MENKVSIPRGGMKKSLDPRNLSDNDVTYALNVSSKDSDSDYIDSSFEKSNILSTTFPLGYVVVGRVNRLLKNYTYYFLTNPNTGNSIFGYVDNKKQFDDSVLVDKLEDLTQEEYKPFIELINDECSENKFNLNKLHPIQNIVLKEEKTGAVIYFTDFINPSRYIELDNIQKYFTQEIPCDVDETLECPNIELMRIHDLYKYPQISSVKTISGGSLVRGSYSFLIALSDATGLEISEYTSMTVPIKIWDGTDEITNRGIRITVDDIDPKYTHFKLVVRHNSHLDNTASYYNVGVFSSTTREVNLTSVNLLDRVSIEDLNQVNVKVTNSENLTSFNNSLAEYGLVFEREYNLQPVVNLMGSYFKWQTHVAKEDLYTYPESQKFIGYNRNEVVPLAIRFLKRGGSTTALMPLVGREAIPTDLQTVSNRDVQSLEAGIECDENVRNERWKLYNTATVEGGCGTPEEYVEVVDTFTYSCFDSSVANTGPGSLIVPPEYIFSTLENYYLAEGCFNNLCEFLNEDYSEDIACEGSPCNNDPQITASSNNISEEVNVQVTEITGAGRSFEDVIDADSPYYNKVRLVPNVTNSNDLTYAEGTFRERYMPTETPSLPILTSYSINNPANLPELLQESNLPQTEGYVIPFMEVPIGQFSPTGTITKNYPNSSGGTTPALFYDQGTPTGIENIDRRLWYKTNIVNERALKVVFNGKIATPIPAEYVDAPDALVQIRADDSGGNLGVYNIGGTIWSGLLSDLGNNTIKLKPIANNKTAVLIVNEFGAIVSETISPLPANSRDIYISLSFPWINVTKDGTGIKLRVSPRKEVLAYLTDEKVIGQRVTYDDIVIGSSVTYQDTCTFLEPLVKTCDSAPYKKGSFSYWESSLQYPDNTELYDSTRLVIRPEDIPLEYRNEFENKFTIGSGPSGYRIKSSWNLACKPIRHFKFPDNKISPFMSTQGGSPFSDAYIYPLGVTIDENIINMFLDIARNNELITEDERNEIYAYEIFRGDIALDRSVVASGLLYDTRNYKENGQDVKYLNYPYNSYSQDHLNPDSDVSGGFGMRGSDFGFHSPESDYNNSISASELSVQGYQFGYSKGYFDEVEDHPEMIVLSRNAFNLASKLATIEVVAEGIILGAQAVTQVGPLWILGGVGSTGSNAGGYIAGMVAAGLVGATYAAEAAIYKYPQYRLQWQQTIRDLGQRVNFANYYYSEGNYNLFNTLQTDGDRVRNLRFIKKLKDSRYELTDTVDKTKTDFNNISREYTTYLKVGSDHSIQYPPTYYNYDKESLTYAGLEALSSVGRSRQIQKKIASPYVQLVNYSPSQYGQINRVSWLSTGFRGDLESPTSACLPIFGGDTYITRHTLKRKMPLFLTNMMGQASLTPFDYKNYNNIGKTPKFYISYEITSEFANNGNIFPEIDYEHNFDERTSSGLYFRKPSKFYLFYYGVPSFLTETRINTNYREFGREPGDNFYPNVGDLGWWTQEKNVSIRTPNYFKYQSTYSNQMVPFLSRTLPNTYTKKLAELQARPTNGVIFSLPDVNENGQQDPWLKFRALDFHEFDTKYGKLTELKGIENEAILARFDHTAIMYNKVSSTVDDGSTPTGKLGGKDIFQRRTLSFVNSELGYGGSKQAESVSCEYGHFYTDTVRGQVLHIPTGGGMMADISRQNSSSQPTFMSEWFKRNLPFKILNSNIEGIENLDVDNNYNGIGIAMGYDNDLKRIIITKKDYLPKVDCIKYSTEIGFYTDGCEDGIITCPDGYEYDPETETCKAVYEVPYSCPEGYTLNEETNMCERTWEEEPPILNRSITPLAIEDPSEYVGADVLFFLDMGDNEPSNQSYENALNGIVEMIENGHFNNLYGEDIAYGLVKTNYKNGTDGETRKWKIISKFGPKEYTLSNITAFGAGEYESDLIIDPTKYSPMDLMIQETLADEGEMLYHDNSNPVIVENMGPFRASPEIKKLAYIIGNHSRGASSEIAPTDPSYPNIYEQSDLAGFSQAATLAYDLHQSFIDLDVETFAIDIAKIEEPVIEPDFNDNFYAYSSTWFQKTVARTTCNHYYYTQEGSTFVDTMVESFGNIGNYECGEGIPATCDCEEIETACICTDEVQPTIVYDNTVIDLYDENFFEEVSWTITYDPESGVFTSFMDYTPNYYTSLQEAFESGVNKEVANSWSHGISNKSYGVFYGDAYPMEIEVLSKNSMNSYIGNVELFTEAKRYYDNQDFNIVTDVTFNESIIYNRRECSGKLVLDLVKGRMGQYPITEVDQQRIPITKTEATFNYNYFFDRVVDYSVPFIENDVNQIKINLGNVSFKQRKPLGRINGDYFQNRLTYNKDSRYNLTLKLHKALSNTDKL